MVEVSVKLKGGSSYIATLYIFFNTETSNINKMSKRNKMRSMALPLRLKRTCLVEQYYRHCCCLDCNYEKKLNVTLKLTLDKVICY